MSVLDVMEKRYSVRGYTDQQVEDEKLQNQKQEALDALEKEKELLRLREQEVNVLEKHKEKAKEIYLEEEKQAENKQLSEVAVQKYFRQKKEQKEEEGEE